MCGRTRLGDKVKPHGERGQVVSDDENGPRQVIHSLGDLNSPVYDNASSYLTVCRITVYKVVGDGEGHAL